MHYVQGMHGHAASCHGRFNACAVLLGNARPAGVTGAVLVQCFVKVAGV